MHCWFTGCPMWWASRDSITVAMDWTEFDADDQATIMLSLLTRHGRATPLVWLTVEQVHAEEPTQRLRGSGAGAPGQGICPPEVRVCIVADRGFGDQKLYRMLAEELKFDFVIRFRANIEVTTAEGETRAAAEWVGAAGARGRCAAPRSPPIACPVAPSSACRPRA